MDPRAFANSSAARAPDPLAAELASDIAELFRALADPTRVRIVAALSRSEMCVGDVSGELGMSLSAVSHQLGTLRRLRLVRRQRLGRRVLYALDDQHVAALFSAGLEHAQHLGRP